MTEAVYMCKVLITIGSIGITKNSIFFLDQVRYIFFQCC